MSVPENVMDELAAEVARLKNEGMQDEGYVENDEQEVDVDDPDNQELDDTEQEDESLEGFKSYEQYIEDGGDPDFYRGKKAFAQQRKIIDEMKEIKEKSKKVDDFMFKQEQRHEQEKQKLLKEIEKAKKEARDELDFERYDELTEQEKELQGAKPKQQEGEPQFIAEYRTKNPILNPAAPQFNAAVASGFAATFNAMVIEAERRAGRGLSEAECAMYLEETARILKVGEQPKQHKKKSVITPSTSAGGKAIKGLDAMDAEQKALYKKWANSNDPEKQSWAKTMLENHS